MPPRLTWADLSGLRVGIWGVGIEGKASVRKLRTLGVDPVLVDDHPAAETVEGLDVVSLHSGGAQALASCDVVIASPGISRHRQDLRELEEGGVPVVGALGLWLEEAPADRVVCVTGTKGKSTTVAILGALLEGLGRRCFVGGNLGRPPFDPTAPADVDYWIIEVSSFQAVSLTNAAATVAVTSLYPDHLDWHGDVATYYKDKLSICRRPGAELTVANGDDPVLIQHRNLLGPQVQWVHGNLTSPAWVEALRLRGRHNQVNALIARACLEALGVEADDNLLLDAAKRFTPLQSRLCTVGRIGGVEFVDDSLSTNVLPTVAALSALQPSRIAVLVGGLDRGIDYTPLADHLSEAVEPVLVLTLPQNGERIRQVLTGAHLPAHVEVSSCGGLVDAVGEAFRWAYPEGVVLLSPAAASFGGFRDYRDRARQFVEAARSLGAVETAG
ncbi:MAG: UDP-N-acetylmuramoyl-L-alanine--D-glutamate ligase [Actinomycetota bacterium]